jgi:hypothetical protein
MEVARRRAVAAGAPSRPGTGMEGGMKCSCSGFGAVLEDERKGVGRAAYFTAAVVVVNVRLDGKGIDLGGGLPDHRRG